MTTTSARAIPDFTQFPLLSQNFKHIIDAVKVQWGYPEFYTYMAKLALQDRDVHRQGFPKEVMVELHKLREYHARWLPEPSGLGKWMVDLTVNNGRQNRM